MLSWVNSVRGRPADTGLEKWRETLMQLESVSLGRRDLAVAFSWSLFNWIADVACLGFAAYAAGDHASVAGLTVAYAAARAVGTIPLMPGGLLVVEAVLVPGLVSSGMSLPSAISAMLIYRLISWLLIAAIGWVVFFFMFRTEKTGDSDDDSPTGPLPVAAALERPVRQRSAGSIAATRSKPAKATVSQPTVFPRDGPGSGLPAAGGTDLVARRRPRSSAQRQRTGSATGQTRATHPRPGPAASGPWPAGW